MSTKPDVVKTIARLRLTADIAVASLNGTTYLNDPAREMLRDAATLIKSLQAELAKAQDIIMPFAKHAHCTKDIDAHHLALWCEAARAFQGEK